MIIAYVCCFCFNCPATPESYTYRHPLSLHDSLPIYRVHLGRVHEVHAAFERTVEDAVGRGLVHLLAKGHGAHADGRHLQRTGDRKSTRLNSSHSCASRMPSSA